MSHRMYNVFVRPAGEVAKHLAGVVMLRPGASRGEVESAMVSLPMPLYVPRGADRMRWSGAKLVITTAEGDEVTASPGLALPRTMRAMLHGRDVAPSPTVRSSKPSYHERMTDEQWTLALQTELDHVFGGWMTPQVMKDWAPLIHTSKGIRRPIADVVRDIRKYEKGG